MMMIVARLLALRTTQGFCTNSSAYPAACAAAAATTVMDIRFVDSWAVHRLGSDASWCELMPLLDCRCDGCRSTFRLPGAEFSANSTLGEAHAHAHAHTGIHTYM